MTGIAGVAALCAGVVGLMYGIGRGLERHWRKWEAELDEETP